MGKSGEVEIQPDRAIQKANQMQIHSPIIKTSAKFVIDPQTPLYYEKIMNNKVPSSASPHNKISSPKRQLSQAPPSSFMSPLEDVPLVKQKVTEFVPYTIRDYNFIKINKYYELGGLGSSTIGTEDWINRKRISDKRKEYGKNGIKVPRENSITDSAIEIVEKIKSQSVIHTRHSSALT